MASQSRKARGMRSQLVVSRWFQENGFPNAESTGSGRGGVDILGLVGLAVEVKARTGFDPLAWLRQAHEYADLGHPVVVFRPNGMGETSVGQWGALVRLETLTRLVREAGYGDPLPVEENEPNGEQCSADENQDEGNAQEKAKPVTKRARRPVHGIELTRE